MGGMSGEPEDGIWEKIKRKIRRRKHPKIKCNTDNIIYARRINNQNLNESDFIILTKIGIGDYGMDSIEKISIHLRIDSQNSKIPKVEIQRISPTDEIRTVGTITHKDNIITNMGGGVDGNISSELDLKFLKWKIGGEAKFTKKNDSEVMVTYNYPKQFLITKSSGAGNDAMWDFKQGESFGWKGQYDLNIVFTIRKSIEEIQKYNPSYYLKYDIFINNKKIKFEPNGPVKNSAPIEFLY